MSRRIFGWDYPPGTEHDPRAPWNEVDMTDTQAFEDEQLRQWNERIMDIHGYFIESLSEADDEVLKSLARMIWVNKNGMFTEAIGGMVTKLVIDYCKPDDQDIIDELNDSAECAADMAADAKYELRKEREYERVD